MPKHFESQQSKDHCKTRPACLGAKRIRRAISLAADVLHAEGLTSKTFRLPSGEQRCQEIGTIWKQFVDAELGSIRDEVPRALTGAAFKGCKRLFDYSCRACDSAASKKCKEEWLRRMSEPMEPLPSSYREEIKVRARRILGKSWWSNFGGQRETVVPDQSGCLENSQLFGGTLAVPTAERPVKRITWAEHIMYADLLWSKTSEGGEVTGPEWWRRYFVREGEGWSERTDETFVSDQPNHTRLGCAKTKGKFRVVTMQGAEVKRWLRPVHEAAYAYISRSPWLVRGQVDERHMEPLLHDLKPDEFLVSGDYEAATDNLNPDAVLAVVEVMAEQLEDWRGRMLVDSFTDLVTFWNDKRYPIRRGSMMGNLGSFVVLCLLNKISYDVARETYSQEPLPRGARNRPDTRVVRINGDDIAFCGSRGFVAHWRATVKRVGFKVNEEKTGLSRTVVELNSQPFVVRKNGRREAKQKGVAYRLERLRKLSFGFLLWNETGDEGVTSLFQLASLLSYKNAAWVLTTPLVQALLRSKSFCVGAVPRRWWKVLLRKAWFRSAIQHDDWKPPSNERVIPTVDGYPLKAEYAKSKELAKTIELAELGIRSAHVSRMRGNFSPRCPPPKLHIKFNRVKRAEDSIAVVISRERRVKRRWLKETYDSLMRDSEFLFEKNPKKRGDPLGSVVARCVETMSVKRKYGAVRPPPCLGPQMSSFGRLAPSPGALAHRSRYLPRPFQYNGDTTHGVRDAPLSFRRYSKRADYYGLSAEAEAKAWELEIRGSFCTGAKWLERRTNSMLSIPMEDPVPEYIEQRAIWLARIPEYR